MGQGYVEGELQKGPGPDEGRCAIEKKEKKNNKKKYLTGETKESLGSLDKDNRQPFRGSICVSSKRKCRLLHESVR